MLRTLTLLYAIFVSIFPAFSQSGSLDAYFGDAGKVTTDIDNWDVAVSMMVAQPDGKIIIVGSANGDFLLIRYHEDGALDQTFGNGGKVTTDFNSREDHVSAIAIQPDGKIVVVGRAKNDLDFFNGAAARYLPDGTPDNTFSGDGKVILNSGSSIASGVTLQPDGSMIISITTDYWSSDKPNLLKLTPNGAVDRTFGEDGLFSAYPSASGYNQSIQSVPDGKILMAGYVTDTLGQKKLVLSRYLQDGTPDSSFATDGSASVDVSADAFTSLIKLRPDGKMIISTGYFDINLIQLNADGSIDSSFGTNGITSIPPFFIPNTVTYVPDLIFQSDNKTIVTCWSSIEGDPDTVGLSVFRFTQNGILDSTFNGTGIISKFLGTENTHVDHIRAAVQPSDKIVITVAINHHPTLFRYNSNGVFDAAFNANATMPILGGGRDRANAIASLPDGKILVSGHSMNEYTKGIAITRYLSNGQPDTSFNYCGSKYVNLGMNDIHGSAMAVKPDGKIVIGAYRQNGIYMGKTVLFQFHADGSPDSTFSNDGETNTPLAYWGPGEKAIAIQDDGKILLSGSADIFNTGNANMAVARYHANGIIDSSFSQDGIVESDIAGRFERAAAIALQADGKIVIAGYTDTNYVTNIDLVLMRFHINGSPDSSFGVNGMVRTSTSPPEGGEYPSSLLIQPDGKILVIAQSYLNEPTEYKTILMRYHANGSIDSTFGSAGISIIPVANYENSIALQDDGKILIVAASNNITLIRCNADGSVDTTFGESGFLVTPVGASSEGTSIALQPDGRILVAGRSFNGKDDDFVVLKFITDLHIVVEDLSDARLNNMLIYPNPIAEIAMLKFDLPESVIATLSLFSSDGKEVITFIESTSFPQGKHQVELTFPKSLAPGYYFLQLRTKLEVATVKILKK